MIIRSLIFGVSALALTACASKGTPPPEIAYDSGEFAPAVVEPDPPKPVQIVTVPEPLPLPGQLKPVPDRKPSGPDTRPLTARVDAANMAARLEPTRDGYVNAMQVYPFTEGALYRLYASPEQVSDIALQPGEKLVAVSAGDTVRWVVGDTTSGTGDAQQVHVLVKPVAAGLKTNLVITTDRRAYHLELESTEATYMASVSWHYPHDELVALRRQNERASDAEARIVDEGLSLDRLRFRYEITGDRPALATGTSVRRYQEGLYRVSAADRSGRGAAAVRDRSRRRSGARQLPGSGQLLRRRSPVRRRRAAPGRRSAAGRPHHPQRWPSGDHESRTD